MAEGTGARATRTARLISQPLIARVKKGQFRGPRVSKKLTLSRSWEPSAPPHNPTFPPPYPHHAPTVPPPYPFYDFKVASHMPDWGYSEYPKHSGCGAMSPSFRLLERGSVEGRQGLRKSKEMNGLRRLIGFRAPDCRQQRPVAGVKCTDCTSCFISIDCAGVESE